ncbi:MAG TPA: helix-turn-helix transcriptional regulator [Actinomycetota bacterium]|jgi:DNA-binding PadR family transcriptional regulator|nr:helix-turn-helix transcriptional regulator [Actinomycetota bacterium]
MRREQLKGHLDLLLLSVLADGPAHGYAVIAALRERSDQAFTLPEGTVYPALHRLEAAGLLRSDWAEQSGRRRRLYELTASGVSVLEELRGEWRRFSTGIRAVVGGPA